MKGAIGAILLAPVVLLLLVIPLMSSDPSATCGASGDGGSVTAAGKATAWTSYNAEQMSNAAVIINVGAGKHISAHGQQIAIMVAIDESGLRNLSGGDRDSVGLFQQRPSMGWGTVQQLLDPTYTSNKFYDALVRVAGWESMTPETRAAHAVQVNADPGVYQQFWPAAGRILAHLSAAAGTSASTAASTAAPSPSASSSAEPSAAAAAEALGTSAGCAAGAGASDTGGGGFQVNSAVAYVGAYNPTVLLARAQSMEGDGQDWYRACEKSVEVLGGRQGTNFYSAASAMASFQSSGTFHTAGGLDGHAPPAGAWLFYSNSGNPYGHVTTYLGNGQVMSTDAFGVGRVGIGKASAITDGPWRLTYRGWAVPWATASTDVPVKAPIAAPTSTPTHS